MEENHPYQITQPLQQHLKQLVSSSHSGITFQALHPSWHKTFLLTLGSIYHGNTQTSLVYSDIKFHTDFLEIQIEETKSPNILEEQLFLA